MSNNMVPSQRDLDVAQATLHRAKAVEATARAQVTQAQAALEADETDLSKAVIHSPINGIVLTRNVEPGQTVAASFQAPVLFTLAEDLTQMELHVDADEADVGQVTEGQEAVFSVDAHPGRTFPARITQVRYGSQTINGVVTYKTVLIVDNSDLSLRPGMTATADIFVKKVENAILLPNAALRFNPSIKEKEAPSDGGSLINKLLPRRPRSQSKQRKDSTGDNKLQQVWTLRDGKLLAIAVRVGATDGRMTEVTSGDIKPGMPLVVDTKRSGR
ncbi:MAG: efflux RND transporter periplasmic adaptor subunit [Desulfobacterales bacterium]